MLRDLNVSQCPQFSFLLKIFDPGIKDNILTVNPVVSENIQ